LYSANHIEHKAFTTYLSIMAQATLNQQTQTLLQTSFGESYSTSTNDAVELSSKIYPQATYTDDEKKTINDWVTLSSKLESGSDTLRLLNSHLSTRTTILGSKPSVADVAVYAQLAPFVKNWSAEEKSGEKGYHHITRHIDFVQNAAVFQLKIAEGDKVQIDPTDVKYVIPPLDAKAEKERKKREKEASAGKPPGDVVGEKQSKTEKIKEKVHDAKAAVIGAIPGVGDKQQKKEKKVKPAKAPAPAAEVKPLSPAQIDLRVGHILKCEQHPNADSLFVSTIACGDAPGADNTSEYEGKVVRTVCSGLNGLIPLAEMQNRKIIAVCNLKPVTMRGVKSCAMVLAASPRIKEGETDDHKGPVELVSPPAGAEAGERVYFEGWQGEPDSVLNPKKKIWESIQPGFTTTDDLGVGFEVEAVTQLKDSGKSGIAKLRTKQGECTVPTLKGATVR
jgi:aminoacyl tRNA synthase complex-interacting multifunctional protein 1